MPEDCFKFRTFDSDYNVNDDKVRQAELKMVSELADPFGDVFQELGSRKTGVDTKRNIDAFSGPDGLDNSFEEGSQFDIF